MTHHGGGGHLPPRIPSAERVYKSGPINKQREGCAEPQHNPRASKNEFLLGIYVIELVPQSLRSLASGWSLGVSAQRVWLLVFSAVPSLL